MTILEIKKQIASENNMTEVGKFPFQSCLNEDKTPNDWVQYFNNDKRFRVVMHKDVATKIKANTNCNTLTAIRENKTSTNGNDYIQYLVVEADIAFEF